MADMPFPPFGGTGTLRSPPEVRGSWFGRVAVKTDAEHRSVRPHRDRRHGDARIEPARPLAHVANDGSPAARDLDVEQQSSGLDFANPARPRRRSAASGVVPAQLQDFVERSRFGSCFRHQMLKPCALPYIPRFCLHPGSARSRPGSSVRSAFPPHFIVRVGGDSRVVYPLVFALSRRRRPGLRDRRSSC